MAEIPETYDIFLSHAFAERQRIETARARIAAWGYSVYVERTDDAEIERRAPDRGTAERLRDRLRRCRSLIYAVSTNAKRSRWMPWELGFADASCGRIFVLPLDEGAGDYARTVDFLALYPIIDTCNLGGFLRRNAPKGQEQLAAYDRAAAIGARPERAIAERPRLVADPAAAVRWHSELWRAWWSMFGIKF